MIFLLKFIEEKFPREPLLFVAALLFKSATKKRLYCNSVPVRLIDGVLVYQ